MSDILDEDLIGYVDFDEYIVKPGTEVICDDAFYECRELKRIILPSSCLAIGRNAFRGCTSLQEVVLPDSLQIIESRAFWGCRSLRKIILPDSITKIGEGAFGECESLEEIKIPSNLLVLEQRTFLRCTNLKKVIIPATLAKIERNPFIACRCNIITNMSPLFGYDDSLHFLYNKKNKTIIAFLSDEKEIHVPSNIERIGEYSFAECSIEKIGIPSSLRYIMREAFDLSTIKQVFLDGDDTIIDDTAFSWGLKIIIVPQGTASKYKELLSGISNSIIENGTYINHSNVFYSLDMKTLLSYASSNNNFVIPDTVTTIADEAFAMCDIETVTIPSSVTTIGHKAFASCYDLEKIFLYSKQLTIWNDAFEDCFDDIPIIKYDGTETTSTELLKYNKKQ